MASEGASDIVVRGKVASEFLADNFGWDAAFYLWMGGTLGAAILLLFL